MSILRLKRQGRATMTMSLAISLVWFILMSAAAGGGPPAELTNAVGVKLVRIEPGQFLMGNGSEPPRERDAWETRDWDESPAHKVKISTAFYLGVFEITNAQYEKFDPDHHKLRGQFGASRADNEPVTHVTWQQ